MCLAQAAQVRQLVITMQTQQMTTDHVNILVVQAVQLLRHATMTAPLQSVLQRACSLADVMHVLAK
jgi:hypothetical protein